MLAAVAPLRPAPPRRANLHPYLGTFLPNKTGKETRFMVQPQYVPPAKKGLGVWAWLAIGCFGLLLVGGVAAGGFLWWGAKKVKNIAEEAQDNPSLMAVKMITAADPDLELVSTDEAAGKVTIKKKSTGEVVTVDLEDVKDGKISFETAEGKGSLSFSQESGTMEVQGADGSRASFGGAAELPGWVPAYPGATPEGVYSAEDAAQRGGTFSLTTTDSVNDVFNFYKGQLEGAGFKVTESKYSGTGMVVGESTDGQRTVTFTIAAEPGKTRVAGVFSEKKG
jgi:hypothetical protein